MHPDVSLHSAAGTGIITTKVIFNPKII